MDTIAQQIKDEMMAAALSRQPLHPKSPDKSASPISSNSLSAAYPDRCNACLGSGYRSWKTPDNYPMAQVEFCDCEEGDRTRAYWERKAAQKQRQRLDSLFTLSGVPQRYHELTLDTFRPLAANDSGKLAAFRAVEEFIGNGYVEQRGKPRRHLLLSGPFGTGKTGLLTTVVRHHLDAGRACLWIEFYDFCAEVQAGYGNGESESRIKAAIDADLLLLDDVGDAERNHSKLGFAETEDKRTIFRRIINARYNADRVTLLTTNLTPEQMAQQFDVRTVDRLMEMCAMYRLAGKNLRE